MIFFNFHIISQLNLNVDKMGFSHIIFTRQRLYLTIINFIIHLQILLQQLYQFEIMQKKKDPDQKFVFYYHKAFNKYSPPPLQTLFFLKSYQTFFFTHSIQIMDSDELQQKQSYVYQNIMEADYDIQAFAQYLASVPPMFTANLQKIPLQVIKKAVHNFIKNNRTQQSPKNNQKQQAILSQSQASKFNIDYSQATEQYYIKSRQCIKQINQFSLTSINLNIISFKKNEGGMLSRDFITYKIELPQFEKVIERRYSDFQWLRNILQYYHPGIVVPPLPKKKLKKIFTEQHLKKKGRMLQNFLRKCLQIPDLRNDQNMYNFLSIQLVNKFQQYKKTNKVLKGFVPLQKIKSATGTIQYGISKQIINVNKKGIQYFKDISPTLKLVYKQVKRIQQNLGICYGHLNELEILCKKMMPLEASFRNSCNIASYIEQQQSQPSFFQSTTKFIQKYKNQIKGMKQNWEKGLYTKMKYQFHHAQAFAEIVSENQSAQKQFYSLKQKLKNKKMKAYSRPVSQWEVTQQQKAKFTNQKPSFNEVAPLMMRKKTQQLAQAQFYYALNVKQLNNSIVHYAKHNNLYNLKTLQQFLLKQHSLQFQWNQSLKNMIANDLKFGQKQNKKKQISSPSKINTKTQLSGQKTKYKKVHNYSSSQQD